MSMFSPHINPAQNVLAGANAASGSNKAQEEDKDSTAKKEKLTEDKKRLMREIQHAKEAQQTNASEKGFLA